MPTTLVAPMNACAAATPDPGDVSWGVAAVGAAESPYSGAGVRVAVLDTGIDSAHEAFDEVSLIQEDFTGEGDGDAHGHGTHCAGTIAGRPVEGHRYSVAPGIGELLIGKVLSGTGRGSTTAIARGILWAVDQRAAVVSISLGLDFPGYVMRLTRDMGLELEPAISKALEGYRDNLRFFEGLAGYVRSRKAFGDGCVIVAAAGNESQRGGAKPYTIGAAPPAASVGFVPVGALAPGSGPAHFEVAQFSNADPAVVAPGVDVFSARAGGGYARMSGTSMATPHVAGVAALWAQRLWRSSTRLDGDILAARLVGTARELSWLDRVDVGAGLVQAPKEHSLG